MRMGLVGAQFINGIALGAIYGLMATGFNLLLVVAGVFHYGYPHTVVFCMYIAWMVLRATGGNVALAVLAAIGGGVGMSLLSEPFFRPLTKQRDLVATCIVSLGMAIILTDVMARIIHRGVPIGFPLYFTGGAPIVKVGLATMSRGQLSTILVSVIVVVVFLYMLHRTKLGRSFRAIAQSFPAARLLGIPVVRTSIYSYIISGLVGGITAVLLAMFLGAASASFGDILAIKTFAVVMFAGLGNLRGGLICGLILGLAETFVIGYLPGDWSDAIALGMIMAVVIWKPQGLFGLRA